MVTLKSDYDSSQMSHFAVLNAGGSGSPNIMEGAPDWLKGSSVVATYTQRLNPVNPKNGGTLSLRW